MVNIKDKRYVSVADVFHPSTASSAVNPAWRPQAEDDHHHHLPPGNLKTNENKWSTVWAEAVVIPSSVDESHEESRKENPGIPVASPEPPQSVVYDDDDETNGSAPPPPPPPLADPSGNPEHQESSTPPPSYHPCRNGHLMDILLGSCIALAAVATTYGLEIAAVLVYLLACLFFQLASRCKDVGVVFLFFYALFLLVTTILLLVDTILLTISVFMAELLATVAFLLCFLFGGPTVAGEWRQYIRRICHLTRWAFRDFHSDWKLQRSSLAFLQVADKIEIASSVDIPASAVLVDEDAGEAHSVTTTSTVGKKDGDFIMGSSA